MLQTCVRFALLGKIRDALRNTIAKSKTTYNNYM